MTVLIKTCNNCKHLRQGFVCPAYPKGVPMAFASGDVEHTVKIEGQVGDTVYAPRENENPDG